MQSNSVNVFLDRFLAVADAGFGLIHGDVTAVLNALIVISIALAGLQWALAGEPPMAPFFRKVLFTGFFAFLVNNWDHLATVINQSGAMLGLKAGGGSMSMADLHNPGRVAQIGVDLFGRTAALGQGMNIITDFMPLVTILAAAISAMLGFFVLALQLFVALIAFKIGSLAAFVALPWGVFNGTSWVAERPLGWVAGSAVRLFVLALVASVSLTFVSSLPQTLSLDGGGALNVLLFGLTVLALAWFGPMLAAEVVQGQPHLAGADVWRSSVAAVATGAGAAMLTRSIVSGAAFSTTGTSAPGGRGGRSGRSGRGGGSGPRSGFSMIDYSAMIPKRASQTSSKGKDAP